MRSGLRNEDVNHLARLVQQSAEEGFGPEEAWTRAKLAVRDVLPEVLEAWKPEVMKIVKAGNAAVAPTAPNLYQRAAQLEAEVLAVKRQVVELGRQNEELRSELAKVTEERSAALADLAKVTAERDELVLGDKGKGKR